MVSQLERSKARKKLTNMSSNVIIDLLEIRTNFNTNTKKLNIDYDIVVKIALGISVEAISRKNMTRSLISNNPILSIFKEVANDLELIRNNLSSFPNSLFDLKYFIQQNTKLIVEEDLGGVSELFSGHKAAWIDGKIKLIHNPDRRNSGKIYTPFDVTKHMCADIADRIVSKSNSLDDLFGYKILDPAVGSGAYLAQLVRCLWKSSNKKWKIIDELSFRKKVCEKMLYACDLDHQALELSKIVLWLSALCPNTNLDLNLKLCDSLSIGPCKNKEDWTSITGFNLGQGYDCVIGNPPYIRVKKNYLDKFKTNKCNNTYAAFTELSLNLLSINGFLSIIVPQSFMVGNNFKPLREIILSLPHSIKFQVFDSVPDFLFDQGKIDANSNKSINQRTTIITVDKSKSKSLSTSPLMRWRRIERNSLFNHLKSIRIRKKDIINYKIPMVENKEDINLYRRLNNQSFTIADVIDDSNGDILYIPQAVRYFITSVKIDLNRKNTILLKIDKKYVDLVHICLNSNLFYWWWRVIGNGFQIKKSDILSFPLIDIDNTISSKKSSELIDSLDDCRVYKMNSGILVPNVNYNKRQDLLKSIDLVLLSHLGLEPHDRIFTCKSNSISGDMSQLVGYGVK